MIPTTRIKTYVQGDIVSATELNAIQDRIADTANVANRLATLSTAESVWIDRTSIDGTASMEPVTGHGFVKLQAGGQQGRLRLPGVPDGLALYAVRIQCYIPAGQVAFALWRTVASEAAGIDLISAESLMPGWSAHIPATTDRETWRTIELTGPPVATAANTTLWVRVENRHTPLTQWNSLILGSVQGVWE